MTEVEILSEIGNNVKAIAEILRKGTSVVKQEDESARTTEYETDYQVVPMGDGKWIATRSSSFDSDDNARPLLRKDIYRGREEIAECEYAHAFMCGGFPIGRDSDRPSKEEWMNERPFPHEVDTFVTEKIFGDKGYLR